jgi:hypothetical protein
MHAFVEDLGGRGAATALGMAGGAAIAWGWGRWKRHQQRQSILRGDARDTIVVHQHIVETAVGPDGTRVPTTLRIRSLGQGELCRVVPNEHLAAVFHARAWAVSPRHTLISMEGSEGSYLLETLTGWVCDRVGNGPFDHDLYVMAPCCEPGELAQHQPVTVILIAAADLPLFADWSVCRTVAVEHGGDGARLLTLMEMARRHRAEQQQMATMRAAGQRTRHVETMYVLDLALDKRSAPIPTRPVPWGRYEAVLKEMGLE